MSLDGLYGPGNNVLYECPRNRIYKGSKKNQRINLVSNHWSCSLERLNKASRLLQSGYKAWMRPTAKCIILTPWYLVCSCLIEALRNKLCNLSTCWPCVSPFGYPHSHEQSANKPKLTCELVRESYVTGYTYGIGLEEGPTLILVTIVPFCKSFFTGIYHFARAFWGW